MRRFRITALAAVPLLALSACVGEKASTKAIPRTPAAPYPLGLDLAKFGDSATIRNEWWPLKPGTQWTWRGEAFDGEDRISRRVVFTVTDLTKTIGGIRAVVGYDLDYDDDELGEVELIFLAQDDDGNVWHLGQYAESYEEGGELAGASAWLAGYLEGAKPGIMMKADPRVGRAAYAEGFAPAPYYWDDHAKLYKVGQRACVPAGCYTDVVVMREFEPRKPGAFQLKYYARGVGNIKVGWAGNDEEKEVLELVKVAHLTPEALAKVREQALAMERRASVYGGTSPAQTIAGAGPSG